MAVKVKWTGNAADLPHQQETNKKPTVRYVGTGEGGVTYQPSVTVKTKNSENTDLGGSTKKGDRVIGSPGGTFLGGFSYKGKSRREKTAQEQEAEKQAQMEAYEEYVRLATLDLDAQEKAIAEAKEKAARSKPKYNIHAFGAYDTTPTDEEKNYSKLLADLNKAKSIQYDIKGRKELDALTAEQTDALGRLSKASGTQTAVMATNQAREAAAAKAEGELMASGLSDEKIRELLGYYKNIPKREKNAELYEEMQQAGEAYAETNPGLATVTSVGTNLVSGIGAIKTALDKAIDPDTPIDYHGGAFLPYAYTSGVRNTVSKNLETDYGKGASFAYGVGTSMLDSAATVGMTMAGVPAWLATSTLGGAAATAAMQEAKDRGLDDNRAIWTGLLAGAAETAFEKISLESLISMKAPTGTMRERILGTIKNTAKQAGVEGSEEVFTDFANLIADGIVNGDLSQVQQTISGYIDDGMTEQEARNKAVGEWLKDTAVDFAAGALAGGIMGGGANALSRASQKAEIKREYTGREQELIDKSKELLPDNQEAEKLRSKMQSKLERGKGLSGGDIEQLLQSNEDAPFVRDVDKITEAVKNQLELYGESGNTDLIAAAVAKRLLRENESGKETEAFVNSKYGRRVLNELNPENFDGDNRTEDDKPRALFNSEWTGKIGTKVFAPEVFSRDVGVTGAKYNAENGKLDAIVKDDAGKIKTVPAEKAELSPLQEELFDWAADLGEAGPVLVSAYRQTQNLETYARQFHNAYEYGKAGVPMDYVNKSQAVSYLSTTQREIAYEEGAKAHQRELQGRQEKKRSGGTVDSSTQKKPTVSLRGAAVGGVKYAPVNKKAMDGRQWASVGTMKAFAQATGVNVVFYESQANERGEYEGANGFYKDGTLYLDINAGRDRVAMGETAILKTAAHEITHYIKEGSPEQYEVLKNFVVEKLTREKGISFDDLVTDKQRREPGLSYEEAVDEVVADACEMMLKDSKAVEQLARENRSLAERIRQWIRKWVRSLKAAMEGLTADRPESRAMMQYAQELQEIWDNALVDAARNGRGTLTEAQRKEKTPNLGNDNTVFVEDGVRYSVRENFSKEIDSWVKDDMPEGVRFTLGSTGPVLQGLGAIESDIYMEGDKIKKIMQDHPEMTLAEIKKVPQILEDPALILKSEGRGKSGANSRLVCFGLTKAQNGQPVMTVMDLRPRENGFVVDDMQKVNSAYTKNNPMAFIQKSDVVYADKKRAIPLLRTTGLTISSQRLLRNGYIGSISYKGSSVNIEGVPFSSVVKMEANDKVQNQQREPRLSDRAVLEWAAEMALRDKSKSWTAEDREQLERFRNRMRMLQDTQAELEALKEERKVLLAGRKVSEITGEERTEVTQNKNRIDIAKNKAERYEAAVWELESKAVIKKLLKKSRSIVEADAADTARRRYREQRYEGQRKAVERRKVERVAKKLITDLNTNNDKKHIPEPLKRPIGELLESLDFISGDARANKKIHRRDLEYGATLRRLKDALDDYRKNEANGTGEGIDGYIDLPPDLSELISETAKKFEDNVAQFKPGTNVIASMNSEDLLNLYKILSSVREGIVNIDKMYQNEQFKRVKFVGEKTIRDLAGKEGDAGTIKRMAMWDNTLPWYAFQRFGEGGRSIFEELMNGQDKFAYNANHILEFRKKLIDDKTVRAWDNEIHELELSTHEEKRVKVTMTTTQLMNLYLLSRRKHGLNHILHGGIRLKKTVEPTLVNTVREKVSKDKKKLNQEKTSEHFKLEDAEVGRLLKLLTPEQIKVANALQKFAAEVGGAWGNEITMRRFGFRGFTEENYWTIEVDKQDHSVEPGDKKDGSLYRLQNISAVKPLTEEAKGAVVIRGVFDVFSDHMTDMAKYNAFVLPIIDAQRWLNYKTAHENDEGHVNNRSVQRSMTKVYGEAANNYVIEFLRDLNGVKESGDRGDTLTKRMISKAKRVKVALNFNVAAQQPTSYMRASAVLEHKYLAKAFAAQERDTTKDKLILEQDRKELLQYSGIALWKEMGFFDTDIGHSLREQIKGGQSLSDKIVDKTMLGAEWGDKLTWARLWRACKLEVQDKQHLTGEAMLKAAAKRFREVIYRTQVVDSTLTRSHNMRSNSTFAKFSTAFMSEPTVSYNVAMYATENMIRETAELGLKVAVKRNWRQVIRQYQAVLASGVAAALVSAIDAALRDPDDDPFFEKVWKEFFGEKSDSKLENAVNIILGLDGTMLGEINPLSKLPELKGIVNTLSGFGSGRMDMDVITNAQRAVQIWDEYIRLQSGDLDEPTKTTYYGNMTPYGRIYPTLKALSDFSGLPISNLSREVTTLFNTGCWAFGVEENKVRTYQSKQLKEAWENYGKASGVSYAVMYQATQDTKEFESDKDKDGNTISGSLKAKYVDYIKGLGLNRAQGKAVWEAAKNPLWSDKGTPWG